MQMRAPMQMRPQGGTSVGYAPSANSRVVTAPAQAQVPYYGGAKSSVGSSSVGGFDDDESPLAGKPKPSAHVHHFVNHIVEYENRCAYLEDRNLWLTGKLLDCQKNFIERTLASGPKALSRRSFKGWVAIMTEMRLERHLHEQTASLDQCQQVARELGDALRDEQGARADTELQHRAAQKQYDEATKDGQRLEEEYQSCSRYAESLEKMVKEAEGCLTRARVEAMNVIEQANRYEAKVKELKFAAKDRQSRAERPGGEDVLEYAHTTRDEAHESMSKVSHLLPVRSSNPENERM